MCSGSRTQSVKCVHIVTSVLLTRTLGQERSGHWPKVTHVVSGRARIQTCTVSVCSVLRSRGRWHSWRANQFLMQLKQQHRNQKTCSHRIQVLRRMSCSYLLNVSQTVFLSFSFFRCFQNTSSSALIQRTNVISSFFVFVEESEGFSGPSPRMQLILAGLGGWATQLRPRAVWGLAAAPPRGVGTPLAECWLMEPQPSSGLLWLCPASRL